MLTELCAMLHNWFNIHHDADIYAGTYTIENGSIGSLPFLKNGQYFRVVGSALNDGVYQYPVQPVEAGSTEDPAMLDETFDGAVWAMFVPTDVVALAARIKSYNEQVAALAAAEANRKGYSSENWGGYSYTLFGAAPPGMERIKAGIDAQVYQYRKLVIF